MITLTEKQWAIIHAALLETPHEMIIDNLGGTEYHPVTEEEIDEVFWISQQEAGIGLPQ